jgi:hypothetical protein
MVYYLIVIRMVILGAGLSLDRIERVIIRASGYLAKRVKELEAQIALQKRWSRSATGAR